MGDDRPHHALAIDHGTSGIKTAIVSSQGEILAFDFEATPTLFLPDGGAEQDPELWWRALTRTARRALEAAPITPDQIDAVCVSSTMSTTVAVDDSGRHVMNALTWMDSRGAPHVQELMRGFPSVQGYGLRKLAGWVRRSGGGPSLSGKDDIAHVLFMQKERPREYLRTHCFLSSKDYLNARLTGCLAASYDSIHLFWVTNIRDMSHVHYDARLLKAAGLDRAKLPPLKASTSVLGPLSPEASEAIGLPAGVPVMMGSPDHQAALIGSGAVRDFEAHLYIGTSSWIECMVPFKRTDALHAIASFPSAIRGRYQCVNEQDLAGGCLDFLIENLLEHMDDAGAVTDKKQRFARLDEIASSVAPGSGGVIFTPWLNGERTPVDDHTLRGGFHNLSRRSTMHHMVRAVMEGVALNTRWSLEAVEGFVGRRLDPIRMIGGGARSEFWSQLFADVLGRRIEVVADPLETNARGAAFLAFLGLGVLELEDIPARVTVERSLLPDPSTAGIYDRHFEAFRGIHRQSRALSQRLRA